MVTETPQRTRPDGTASRVTAPAGAPASVDPLGGGRALALLVASVALSVVAALIVTATGQPTAAPADTPTPGAAEPATGPAQAPPPAPEPRSAPSVVNPGTDAGTPVGTRGPTTVRLELETVELEGQLADGTTYTYWTFGGTVPGPTLRVREGDSVEVTLTNAPDSTQPHSIDLHAVNGPGGGAGATQTAPGETTSFTFRAMNPGVYVYHCATPHIPSHVANGMYGLIVAEPEGGLEPVDREFAVVQGEVYSVEERGTPGLATYDAAAMMAERPTHVVFNGAPAALTGDRALTAEAGDRVRVFVGNGGPNLTSSFHVIGEVFDRVGVEGGSLVNTDVQTTLVPAGGATWVEFTVDVPGDYLLVDHALTRALDGGAVAVLRVTGPDDPSVFAGGPAGEAMGGHGEDGHAMGEDGETAVTPPVGGGTVVEVSMTEFAFAAPTSVPAGTVTLRISNAGVAPHELALSPAGAGHAGHLAETGDVAAGATAELTVDLPPGTYELACHIPGHYEAGMHAVLRVE
jgi:nitrite reductase (NO-forming)